MRKATLKSSHRKLGDFLKKKPPKKAPVSRPRKAPSKNM